MFRRVKAMECFKRFALILVACGLLASCQKEPTWKEALELLDHGVFSFIFQAPPPEGTMLSLKIFERDVLSPCSLFAPDADVRHAAPFWLLSATLGRQTPSVYEISYSGESAYEDRDKAKVVLKHIDENGDAGRIYSAVGGTIEVIEAPQNADEWHDGKEVHVKISAEFPEKMAQTITCEGADGEDGFKEGTCECVDENGRKWKCDLKDVSQETCCVDIKGPRKTYTAELTLEQCADACLWTAGNDHLAQYCMELK